MPDIINIETLEDVNKLPNDGEKLIKLFFNKPDDPQVYSALKNKYRSAIDTLFVDVVFSGKHDHKWMTIVSNFIVAGGPHAKAFSELNNNPQALQDLTIDILNVFYDKVISTNFSHIFDTHDSSISSIGSYLERLILRTASNYIKSRASNSNSYFCYRCHMRGKYTQIPLGNTKEEKNFFINKYMKDTQDYLNKYYKDLMESGHFKMPNRPMVAKCPECNLPTPLGSYASKWTDALNQHGTSRDSEESFNKATSNYDFFHSKGEKIQEWMQKTRRDSSDPISKTEIDKNINAIALWDLASLQSSFKMLQKLHSMHSNFQKNKSEVYNIYNKVKSKVDSLKGKIPSGVMSSYNQANLQKKTIDSMETQYESLKSLIEKTKYITKYDFNSFVLMDFNEFEKPGKFLQMYYKAYSTDMSPASKHSKQRQNQAIAFIDKYSDIIERMDLLKSVWRTHKNAIDALKNISIINLKPYKNYGFNVMYECPSCGVEVSSFDNKDMAYKEADPSLLKEYWLRQKIFYENTPQVNLDKEYDEDFYRHSLYVKLPDDNILEVKLSQILLRYIHSKFLNMFYEFQLDSSDKKELSKTLSQQEISNKKTNALNKAGDLFRHILFGNPGEPGFNNDFSSIVNTYYNNQKDIISKKLSSVMFNYFEDALSDFINDLKDDEDSDYKKMSTRQKMRKSFNNKIKSNNDYIIDFLQERKYELFAYIRNIYLQRFIGSLHGYLIRALDSDKEIKESFLNKQDPNYFKAINDLLKEDNGFSAIPVIPLFNKIVDDAKTIAEKSQFNQDIEDNAPQDIEAEIASDMQSIHAMGNPGLLDPKSSNIRPYMARRAFEFPEIDNEVYDVFSVKLSCFNCGRVFDKSKARVIPPSLIKNRWRKRPSDYFIDFEKSSDFSSIQNYETQDLEESYEYDDDYLKDDFDYDFNTDNIEDVSNEDYGDIFSNIKDFDGLSKKGKIQAIRLAKLKSVD